MMNVTATYSGTATVLLRIGGVTVLTDPTFDPAGSDHVFAVPAPSTAAVRGLILTTAGTRVKRRDRLGGVVGESSQAAWVTDQLAPTG
jgi:L-ascorbate metabolism protein UlaG (beta-lactamase superfamily)